MSRIAATWERLRAERRKALILYVPVGFPERESTLELIAQFVAAGADMIELGVPFSDPVAEGVTIQGASQRALRNGVTTRYCLETVRQLRERGVTVPLLLMGYLNPVLRYGQQRFCEDAHAAGVDGLIFPDLPPEESQALRAACDANDLDLVQFVAPTSTAERITHVTENATGFIYCVAVKGVTGARDRVAPELPGFLARARTRTATPIAVGFGISRPEHAQEIAPLADGIIVGSALVDVIDAGGDISGFIAGLRDAIDAVPSST